jgi:hypothetical protein
MKPFFYVLLGSLLGGCAPASVIRLRPIADETHVADGLEAVKQERGGVKVVTAFDNVYQTTERGQRVEYLIFDTEVTNLTDHDLELRPNDFNAVVLDARQQQLPSPYTDAAGNAYARRYVALDPDQQVTETEVKMKQAEARLKANKVFNTVLFVALAAATVSNSSKPKPYREFAQTANSLNAGFQAWAVKRVADRAAFASRMDRLGWEYNTWKGEPFRRTTLAPGQAVRGRLLVRADREAARLWLTYPTPSGEEIRFLFEQRLVRPGR